MMTTRSYAPLSRRGGHSISSLTWASCVAYPLSRQPKPEFGISKVDSHVFIFTGSSGVGAISYVAQMEANEYSSPKVVVFSIQTQHTILTGSDVNNPGGTVPPGGMDDD